MATENKEDKGRCQTDVSRDGWHWHKCGCPVKGQNSKGEWVCGRHLKMEQKRVEKSAAFHEKWDKARDFRLTVEALSKKCGIYLQSTQDQRVSISLSDLEGLLARVEEAEKTIAEECKLSSMGAEREYNLLGKIERLEREVEKLRSDRTDLARAETEWRIR